MSTRPKVQPKGPAARALEMSAQGYRLEPMPHAYCWRVVRPGERATETGSRDKVIAYHVRLAPSPSCDCDFWSIHNGRFLCKHLEYVRLMLAGARELLTPCVDLGEVFDVIGMEVSK